MKNVAVWLAVAALLLTARAARADTLVYAGGETAHGTVLDVTFRAGDTPGIYARAALKALELSAVGSDKITLTSGATREGTVVTLRFRAAEGVVAIPRERLAAVGLDAPPAPEPKKAEPKEAPKSSPETTAQPPPEPPTPPAVEPAPKKAVTHTPAWYKNFDLRNRFWDEAGKVKEQELDALKAAYMDDCTRSVREIERIEKTIKEKQKAREEALDDWRHDRRREEQRRREGRGGRNIPRPEFKDGLEEDEKALTVAMNQKRELQKTIQAEMDKIDKRAAARRRRVEGVYTKQKDAIEGGQDVTADQMASAYQDALGTAEEPLTFPKAPGPDPKKDGGKKRDDAKKGDGKK